MKGWIECYSFSLFTAKDGSMAAKSLRITFLNPKTEVDYIVHCPTEYKGLDEKKIFYELKTDKGIFLMDMGQLDRYLSERGQ